MSERDEEQGEIIAELYPSRIRYWIGITGVTSLGVFLIFLVFSQAANSYASQVLLGAFGFGACYTAHKMYKNGLHGILLTKDGLFDTKGTAICTIDQIKAVDRSFFALRPSNGFSLTLHEPLDRVWVPGLWWRLGKRVGVGGLTSYSAGKSMADILTLIKNGPPQGFSMPD